MVVVQGTDTIEESSFAFELLVDTAKPIVVTGAMRNATDPGYDGPANLRDAVRCAADPALRGLRGRGRPGRDDRAGRRRHEDAHDARSTRSGA